MREPDMKCEAEVTEVPERENAEEPTQFRVERKTQQKG